MAWDRPAHGVLSSDEEATDRGERFVQPIKQMIEENPSLGYRTMAHLLQLNKNADRLADTAHERDKKWIGSSAEPMATTFTRTVYGQSFLRLSL